MTTSITKIKLKISNAEVDIECDIYNLDESWQSGSHWVALFIDLEENVKNLLEKYSNLNITCVGLDGDYKQNVFNNGKQIFWIGGSLSYIIYIIVVWAFTKAPIPMVGALRETSILFSILIGYFFLNEKITLIKISSIILIVIGVIGIKLF